MLGNVIDCIFALHILSKYSFISSLKPKKKVEMSLIPQESYYSPRLHLHSKAEMQVLVTGVAKRKQKKLQHQLANWCIHIPSRSFPGFTDCFAITVIFTYLNFMNVSTYRCFLAKITFLFCIAWPSPLDFSLN